MTTIQLIKGALYRFPDLKDARKTPFWKTVIYLLALSAVLAIPVVYQMNQIIQDIRSDGQEIAQKLPDFSIVDGQLETEEDAEGFIYQTNSIIFTFDPEGKRDKTDIANDFVGNYFSVGLLKKQLVVAMNTSASTALFGTDLFTFDYSNELFNDLDSVRLKAGLNNSDIPLWLQAIIFVVALYPTFISLLIMLVFSTFGASIYAKLRLRKVTFFECLKTMIYCITLPTLVSVIMLLINPAFDMNFFTTIAGLFIFFQAAKGFPKIELPQM